MKKLLLSLVAILCFGIVYADDSYSVTFLTASSDGTSAMSPTTKLENVIKDGASYIKGIKEAANCYPKGIKGLKFSSSSKNGSVTFTMSETGAVNATKVVVKACRWKEAEAATIAVNNLTAQDLTKDLADYTFNLTGAKLEELTLAATKRAYVESVTVYYATGAAADLEPAGLAWSETAVTVTDDKISEFVAPTLTNPNNLAVTYSSSDENVAEVSEAGVVTLTGDLGKATIKAAFAGNDTYRAGEASYTITVKAAPKAVASVAETIALPTKTEVVIGYELTVGWVNFSNVFACDATGKFIQVYGKNSYKPGDKIPAGWNATYELYSDVTPELMPTGTLPAATEGTFTPKEVAAADVNMDLVNSVVLLKNVAFAEATPKDKTNFTGKVGETELSFRNNYEIASVEAGTYNVTVVVTIFVDKNNNNAKSISLYVTNYEPVQSSGIEDIEVESAEAVYYNLQGVKVANPENGVYIVRRGNKVTKEFIR